MTAETTDTTHHTQTQQETIRKQDRVLCMQPECTKGHSFALNSAAICLSNSPPFFFSLSTLALPMAFCSLS